MSDDAKYRSLLALYEKMDTEEIQRRLASGKLTEVAAEAAREELEMRFAPRSGKSLRRRARIERADAVLAAVSVAVLAVAAFVLLPGPKFIMVLFLVVVPAAGYLLGKAFPLLGKFLGWALVATPLWLGGWMWKSGAFVWESGDFRPLGAILAWVFVILMSSVGMGIGAMMLKGAHHKGSWSDARDELGEQSAESLKPLTRLD